MKKETTEIPSFWGAPSEKKEGPFSKYLIKKLERRVVYVLPVFTNRVPEFFDSKGNFNPFVVDDYMNLLTLGTRSSMSNGLGTKSSALS